MTFGHLLIWPATGLGAGIRPAPSLMKRVRRLVATKAQDIFEFKLMDADQSSGTDLTIPEHLSYPKNPSAAKVLQQ